MIDVTKPVQNPELAKAILEMRGHPSAESQAACLKAVMEATFLLPAEISPTPQPGDETGSVTLKQDTTVGFPCLKSAQDEPFLPVFTDWEELGKWNPAPGQKTLVCPYEDVSALVLDGRTPYAGFVINCGGENVTIRRELILTLRDRLKEAPRAEAQTVEKDTQVSVGLPRLFPQELAAAVEHCLKWHRSVHSAWLLQMAKEGETSYLLVVDFPNDGENARQKLFDSIAAAASPHLQKGELLDMIPFSDPFGQNAAENQTPFYKKKRFGLF